MKKIIIVGNEYEYDYTSEKKGKNIIHKLFFSKSEIWSEHIKGTLAMELEETDNGIKFSDKLKKLDYGDCLQLQILLSVINDDIGTIQIVQS